MELSIIISEITGKASDVKSDLLFYLYGIETVITFTDPESLR